MPRLILIVDDNKINREMLINALEADYDIIEAENGKEALEIMHRKYKVISAVLLDISMPVMDGYAVLRQMRENAVFAQLPVIMVTASDDEDARVASLSLGANDFISKPFNPIIVKHCLRNNILLRESASIINAIQRDKLTSLFNRESFIDKANEMIKSKEAGYYYLSSFDIDNFKLINEQFGTTEGDRILAEVGLAVKMSMNRIGGLAGRVSADNYVAIFPVKHKDNDILSRIENKSLVSLEQYSISFSVGRYLINDTSLSASAAYDRAYLAKQSIKGRYDEHLAYFDEKMLDSLTSNQQITNEMERALEQRQFEVWLQPQYNHINGLLIGAEALIRWRHPTKGLISPAEFIPLFEQNGFIYQLDKFVWKEVCCCIRKWLNEGERPLPISVNISRFDVLRADLIDTLVSYVNFYDIPIDLINLEITETAFTSATKQIISIVQQLVEIGFIVEIDDFGSGYSSLNVLKSVPAQVVKLDMRFLEDDGNTQRGGNILESVVRMAKWLGMSVIAEGVETKEQSDFLKSIGCSRVQGYLYARPMPAEEYEKLFKSSKCEAPQKVLTTIENIDNDQFWSPNSVDTLMFNSYVGAACILEYHNGRVELLRATDKYAAMLTGGKRTVEQLIGLDFSKYFSGDALNEAVSTLTTLIDTTSEITREFVFVDLPGCPHETFIRSIIRVIAYVDDRYLLYCLSDNITKQRMAERKQQQLTKQLQAVLDNINCGITAVTMVDGKVEYLLANDKYYEVMGYTKKQYLREIKDKPFKTIYPADAERIKAAISKSLQDRIPVTLEYRCIKRGGDIVWIRSYVSVTAFKEISSPVQLCTYVDISAEKLTAQNLLDNLPCGAGICVVSNNHSSMEYVNKRYLSYFKHRSDASGQSIFDTVHPEDRDKLKAAMMPALQKGGEGECVVRIMDAPDEYIPFKVLGIAAEKKTEANRIYVTFTPISYDDISFAEMLPVALEMVMECSLNLAFVKDKNLHYVCCSRAFADLVGLENAKDILGKTDEELFEASFAKQYVEVDHSIMKTGESVLNMVETIPSASGKNRYVSTSKFILRDSNGHIIGIYGLGNEITAQREAEQQQQFLIDNIPGGVATYEGEWKSLDSINLTYFSDGFCKLFGYTREEYTALASSNPTGLIYEEYIKGFIDQINTLLVKNEPIDYVYKAHSKGGGYKWIHIKAVVSERYANNTVVNAVFFDVTRRQEMAEQLRISEEENRLAIKHSKNTVARFDVKAQTLTFAPNSNPIFNLNTFVEDVPNTQIKEGKISRETADSYTNFYERIMNGEKSGEAVFQRNSSLGWRWIEAKFSTVFSDGKPVSAVVSFGDVTDNYERDVAYKKWLQSYESKDVNSFTLLRCNISRNNAPFVAAGTLLDFAGLPLETNYASAIEGYANKYVYEQDREEFIAFADSKVLLIKYAKAERILTLDYREKTNNGYRWLRLTTDLIKHSRLDDIEAYFLIEDIDEAKRKELLLQEAIQTDSLTAVYNRTTFESKVSECIKNSPNGQHALFILDVDGFKLINDVFGHSIGDAELIEVGNILKQVIGTDGFVGRLGGDEFLVFINDYTSVRALTSKAKKICTATHKSYSAEVEVYSSVGIALYPTDGKSFNDLYVKADEALYFVKGSGGGNFALYREDMKDEHLKLELDTENSGNKDKKRRMLIVDDSRLDYEVLANIFRDDFIIEKAKDGNSALIRLRHYESAISVVLLDLLMPGMDGYTVLKKMQQSSEMRLIPVIVVSSDETREASLRAIKSGASDFVIKPVDADVLRIRVFSAISKAENERLRVKNNFLQLQSSETAFYKSLLEQIGTVVIEADYEHDRFMYSPSIGNCLAGNYNDRTLWHILLADDVAEPQTVKAMQKFVNSIVLDEETNDESIQVMLKSASGTILPFNLNISKLQDKLLLILRKSDTN